MKATLLVLTAATATSVFAQPHRHGHQHLHDINKRTVTATSIVAGPTAYAFVLDGQPIHIEDVCKGVAGGQLKWQDSAPSGICASYSSSKSSATTSTTAAATTTTPAITTAVQTTTSSSATSKLSTSSSVDLGAGFYGKSSSAATSSSTAASKPSAVSPPASNSGATGVDAPFPDGQLDCGTFPSQYGAVNLGYLGLGGWSGLQAVTFGSNAITHIVTGISGNTCTEGMMCSYACPPGYQKSQWPSTQGATGQSVGGIQCKNGKLWLTNPGLSSSLCVPGMGGVQAKNNAGGVVAICRTDYPGTESETIPVELSVGETQPLTNPNAASYYVWQGQSTSAQYYLNPIGVSAQDGCQWGSAGSDKGNWAPINFGVGHKDGKTWLSIFQNKPTTYNAYKGTVEIKGDVSAVCKYSNGQYCGASGCNADGCTVCILLRGCRKQTNVLSRLLSILAQRHLLFLHDLVRAFLLTGHTRHTLLRDISSFTPYYHILRGHVRLTPCPCRRIATNPEADRLPNGQLRILAKSISAGSTSISLISMRILKAHNG